MRLRDDLGDLFALLPLAAAPLFFLRTADPFLAPKTFALALLAAAAFPLAAARLPPLPAGIPLALLLFAAAPFAPGVPAGTDALDLLLPALKVTLFVGFAAAFARFERRAPALRLLSTATLLASLHALGQYYGLLGPDWKIRQGFSPVTVEAVYASFGNPNFLGEHLALALPAALAAALAPGRFRLLHAAALAVGFVALVVTMSRAAWAAFALALLVAGALLLSARPFMRRLIARPLLPAALFALAVLAVFSTDNPLNRGASMLSGVRTLADRLLTPTGSVSKRLLAWNVAAHALSAHGGGHGAGAFGRDYLERQAEFLARPERSDLAPFADNFDHAHNDWLEDLYDLGPTGCALAWFLPVILLGHAARAARATGEPLRAACAGSLAGFLLLRTVAFPERLPGTYTLFLALAALALAAPVPSPASPAGGPSTRRRAFLAALALPPSLFLLHLTAGRLAADRLLLTSLEAIGRNDPQAALALASTARAIRPSAEADVIAGAALAKAGDFAAAADAYTRALERTADPAVHHNLALARLALGDPRRARESLEAALRLFPCRFESMVPLGRILIRSGLVGPGVGWLRRAARWRDAVFRNPALHEDRLFPLETEAESVYAESLATRGVPLGASPLGPGRVLLRTPRLNARAVSAIGTFNGFDPRAHPLAERSEPGLWEGEIGGLPSGPVEYLLVVDGRKEADPTGERITFADGRVSSILRAP